MRRLLELGLVIATLAALLLPRPAAAIERTFAGSAQLDYGLVPTAPGANANGGTLNAFDGFTFEAAMKVAVDISDVVSANVKACYGCHGFELDMAYFDVRAADEFNVRVGRFSPSFGAYNVRHDPANHKLSDNPLPYDMGRMLRKLAWGNSVLPSPFPDNGVEIDGTHWAGESTQLDYALYGVAGFRNLNTAQLFDLDFQQSHLPYYVDDNARPTGGGRLAVTQKLGETADATLGASGMFGTYDPKNKLTYAIFGGDLSFRFDRTSVRLEYLVRRTDMDTSKPEVFRYAVPAEGGDFFVKHGAYAEVEQPLTRALDFIARVDGMYRVGNVPTTTAAVALSDRSSMTRETLGLSYAIDRNFRLKSSGELWQFSDPDATGQRAALSVHLGAVGTF